MLGIPKPQPPFFNEYMNKKLTTKELNRPSIEEFNQIKKIPVCLILEDIRSRSNVGAIFRSADAFVVEELILCGFTAQPPHRDIHKTALGATDTVKWSYFENSEEAISALRNRGYSIWAAEQTSQSIELGKFEFEQHAPLAIIVGNEVKGVREKSIALADGTIEIPQFGTKHSLNVSVCAGIILHFANHKLIGSS